MTLDQWLSDVYKAEIRGSRHIPMTAFRAALAEDNGLRGQAQTRLNELDALVDARGERACAYSSKYREFLKEALA